jgi:hypothetical protein
LVIDGKIYGVISSADFRLFISLFEQGTIVDRIDYNVQNVAASVEEGYKQLQKVSSSFLFPTSLLLPPFPCKRRKKLELGLRRGMQGDLFPNLPLVNFSSKRAAKSGSKICQISCSSLPILSLI